MQRAKKHVRTLKKAFTAGALSAVISALLLGSVATAAPQESSAEMVAAAAIVRVANAEVGYRERAGNCNKYSSDCAAWCGMFARWVWKKAGVTKLPPAGYGKAWVATYWAQWGADNKLLKRRPADTRGGNPKAGDAIVYGIPGSLNGHVGIVAEVHADGKLTTIDGNVSDKVTKRTIDPKTATSNGGAVYGYVKPTF